MSEGALKCPSGRVTPHEWQKAFLRTPRGASVVVLTARQVGKTTAAAVGMAHSALFMPGSLSVVVFREGFSEAGFVEDQN